MNKVVIKVERRSEKGTAIQIPFIPHNPEKTKREGMRKIN
jgi:hypothetical protein